MLVTFFLNLKKAGVPVSVREFLVLLEAMTRGLAFGSIDDFYRLSRTVLVKDEQYFDRFDRAFGAFFRELESFDDVLEVLLPEDWLRKEFEKYFSYEQSYGSFWWWEVSVLAYRSHVKGVPIPHQNVQNNTDYATTWLDE